LGGERLAGERFQGGGARGDKEDFTSHS